MKGCPAIIDAPAGAIDRVHGASDVQLERHAAERGSKGVSAVAMSAAPGNAFAVARAPGHAAVHARVRQAAGCSKLMVRPNESLVSAANPAPFTAEESVVQWFINSGRRRRQHVQAGRAAKRRNPGRAACSRAMVIRPGRSKRLDLVVWTASILYLGLFLGCQARGAEPVARGEDARHAESLAGPVTQPQRFARAAPCDVIMDTPERYNGIDASPDHETQRVVPGPLAAHEIRLASTSAGDDPGGFDRIAWFLAAHREFAAMTSGRESRSDDPRCGRCPGAPAPGGDDQASVRPAL